MFRLFVLLSLLCVGGCSDAARVYPLDTASMQAGIPKIDFVRQGLGRGPVTVTMPDGEVLNGEYQVTENAATAVSVVGSQVVSSIGFGSNRHVVLSATGTKTILNCDGAADIGGHGSGTCSTNGGLNYRMMF